MSNIAIITDKMYIGHKYKSEQIMKLVLQC
jgi:hypothetical protein